MTMPDDTRVIDSASEQYNAELVRREDETDDLAYFWVRSGANPSRSSRAST